MKLVFNTMNDVLTFEQKKTPDFCQAFLKANLIIIQEQLF